MAITITNTGADTFITDGSQNPSFNKNFIAGLTKATAINNPLTAGLDSVLVLDNTGRSIIMAYPDITDINGSTPAALGLLDASQVASYLNNNFFEFGDSGLTSVATASPLTGDGTLGNPVKFEDGSKSGQIPIWDGSQWIYSDLPSYTVNYLNNAVTLPFAGGFNLSGGGTNGNNIVGTFLYRNNNNASILSPAEPGKGPILQLVNTSGGRTHVSSTFGTGYFRISSTSSAKYYVRAKLRITQAPLSGSCYFGFVQEPVATPSGGFRITIQANGMFPVIQNGATSVPGTSIAYNLNQWYDILLEYQFVGGIQVLKVYIDGVIVQTHTFTPAGAFDYQNCRLTMTNAGSTNAWIIQFEDFIQYAII